MELKTFIRTNADRVLAVGLVLAGAVAIIVGWFGVSGTGLAAEQIPYLVSGGFGGLLFVIVGCTAWMSADLQDEWRGLDAIQERLGQMAQPDADDGLVARPTPDDNGVAVSHQATVISTVRSS